MYNVVTSSKYKNETISIVLDFSDMLKSGETISSCSFSISLLSGIDPTPDSILYQTCVIVGTQADQKFMLGIPGCIYEVVWQVFGSIGSLVEKTTPLAILPQDGLATPQFTFIYLTSNLYPYNGGDYVSVISSPIHGTALGAYIEYASVIAQPSSGTLYGGQVSYAYHAEVYADITVYPVLGSIYGSQGTYTSPTEGYNAQCSPILGSLFGSSISYNPQVDIMSVSVSPASGTIS